MEEKIKIFDSKSLNALWDRIKEKFVPAGNAGIGTVEKEGFTKLYTGTGTNTDGAMTQKAVTETFTNLENTASTAFCTVFTKL
ncbi:MAG: hypothetical protein K1W16_12585 [Lachnospiraceae bacterium]